MTVIRASYRVLYGDTDQMQVVYYANYLRFAELGRNEYIRQRGMPYKEIEQRFRIHLPVVEAQLRYAAPARYDDLLTIETSVGEVKRVSLRFDYRVLRAAEEKLLVHGHTVHACVTFEGKPTRLPDEVAALLR
jgi:acyl-CoA thioester hydrolase